MANPAWVHCGEATFDESNFEGWLMNENECTNPRTKTSTFGGLHSQVQAQFLGLLEDKELLDASNCSLWKPSCERQ